MGNAKYLKTCYDIAHSSKLKKENMKWFGTGQAKKNYYSNLGINASNKTPKTDLYIGKYNISLKMGAAQLMSGYKEEATATFYAALDGLSGLDNTPEVKECSPPKTKGNFLLSNKILFMFSICLRASIIFFFIGNGCKVFMPIFL